MTFHATRIAQQFVKYDPPIFDHIDVAIWTVRPFGEFFGREYEFLHNLKVVANKFIPLDNNVQTEESVTVMPGIIGQISARDFKLTLGSHVRGSGEHERHSVHHVFSIYENDNENWTYQFSIGLNTYGRVEFTSFYTTVPHFIDHVGGMAPARQWFKDMVCMVSMFVHQRRKSLDTP